MYVFRELVVLVSTFTFSLCFRWADKLDSLSATATQDPEGFLGHPVNAFKLMKRLNTEWGDLESLVLSDTTDGIKQKRGGGVFLLVWQKNKSLRGRAEYDGYINLYFILDLLLKKHSA